MRHVFFFDAMRLELRDGASSVLEPPGGRLLDRAEAARLVRRCGRSPALSASFRRVLAAHRPGVVVAHLSEGEVSEALDRLITSGWMGVFVEDPPPLFGLSGEPESEASPSPEPPLRRELHWIMFELVDDDGAPVGGELFHAELADGRVIDARLDGSGRVRWDDLTADGRNKIVFPRIDARLQISSSDEDPAAKPPSGSSMWTDAEGIRYAPGERAVTVPADDAYVYRLPGWTPVRMLTDDEEPVFPVEEADGAPDEEPVPVLDDEWDPVAVYYDVEMDEDRPEAPISS